MEKEKITWNTATSAYITYVKDNLTKWECKEKIDSSLFYVQKGSKLKILSFGDALVACDADPLCNYIVNDDCHGMDGFELCISLTNETTSTRSCAFEKGNNK